MAAADDLVMPCHDALAVPDVGHGFQDCSGHGGDQCRCRCAPHVRYEVVSRIPYTLHTAATAPDNNATRPTILVAEKLGGAGA